MRCSTILLAILAVAGLTGIGQGDPPAAKHDSMEVSVSYPNHLKWIERARVVAARRQDCALGRRPQQGRAVRLCALLPDGYRIPPHTHPKTERITVISGEFNIGMGDKFDETKTKPMTAGTYGFWPAGMKHFVWAKGETIIQLHGMGPWLLKYVNPEDDPRHGK